MKAIFPDILNTDKIAWNAPRLVSPLQVLLMTDFLHYALMPPSRISAYATECGVANVLPIGPHTC